MKLFDDHFLKYSCCVAAKLLIRGNYDKLKAFQLVFNQEAPSHVSKQVTSEDLLTIPYQITSKSLCKNKHLSNH